MPSYDIREFGATPDPTVINTRAIQAAIRACHAAGGGTVYCPPGVFVTGTPWLGSHVMLHLEAGCVLRGSPRRPPPQCPASGSAPAPPTLAEGAVNVAEMQTWRA